MKKDESSVPMALFRYRQEIIDPQCDLAIYISPLSRLENGSLAYLCFDNVARFQTHELITLATLQSLAVLELIERDDTDSKMSDALVRGWSEAGKDPFSRLRVLKIASKAHQISEGGLPYLFKLPCLEIIDITALPTTKLRLSRRIKDALETSGWRVTKPRGSLFVSYANAFLDGRVPVHPAGVETLKAVFEDDRYPVIWVDDSRRTADEQWKGGDGRDIKERSDQPGRTSHSESNDRPDPAPDCGQPQPTDFSDVQYLDGRWRAILQGDPSSTTKDTQQSSSTCDVEGLDDEIFWSLALMDQKRYDGSNAVRGCASGVTLPLERLVCLRLRGPSNTAERSRRLLNSERLIFSRCRMQVMPGMRRETTMHQVELEDRQSCDPPPPGSSRTDDRMQRDLERRIKRQNSETVQLAHPPPSWAPRPEDRREKGLQPRKRLKKPVGEVLNRFMEPQARPG